MKHLSSPLSSSDSKNEIIELLGFWKCCKVQNHTLSMFSTNQVFLGMTLCESLLGKLLSKGFMGCYKNLHFYRMNSYTEFEKIFLQTTRIFDFKLEMIRESKDT